MTVTNRSASTWPDENAGGISPVRLSYRWWKTSSPRPSYAAYESRQNLSSSIQPNQTKKIDMMVHVPNEPGEYNLQFDLVQELVAWYGDKGADNLVIRVRVVD